jgi:hypothetical protein
MTASEIHTEIQNKLAKALGIRVSITVSETDFGTSLYIQNLGYGKIRISDHSVENFDRIWNEYHFKLSTILDSENFDSLIYHTELIFFPEKFETIEIEESVVKFSTVVDKSIDNFKLHNPKAEIINIRPFTNKKGVGKNYIDFKYTAIEKKKIIKRK